VRENEGGLSAVSAGHGGGSAFSREPGFWSGGRGRLGFWYDRGSSIGTRTIRRDDGWKAGGKVGQTLHRARVFQCCEQCRVSREGLR